MLAIGDSVMLGAAPNLAEAGYIVDAAVSRQMIDYVPVLQGAAGRDQIPDVVVVHLGTNGRFSTDTMHAFFDALVSADLVVVLTVHADRGYTAHNNELIMTLPERYSNVRIIDWNALVDQCEGNCLYDDGIHLPPAGRRYYAQLIFDVVGP
jgi:lysophospholipase L1-like esterase